MLHCLRTNPWPSVRCAPLLLKHLEACDGGGGVLEDAAAPLGCLSLEPIQRHLPQGATEVNAQVCDVGFQLLARDP
jgi:hypothetical protein